MAAVPITIVGTLTSKATKEGDVSATEQVVIMGIASLTGLEVGGGPMPGGPPPEIWPSPGRPTHPIWGPPGFNPPGPGMPPGIWRGGNVPYPEHPIVIPGPPPPFPEPPEAAKPPPPEGGWGYDEDLGWVYVPGGSTPGPKS